MQRKDDDEDSSTQASSAERPTSPEQEAAEEAAMAAFAKQKHALLLATHDEFSRAMLINDVIKYPSRLRLDEVRDALERATTNGSTDVTLPVHDRVDGDTRDALTVSRDLAEKMLDLVVKHQALPLYLR